MSVGIFNEQRHRADVTQNAATSPMLQRCTPFYNTIFTMMKTLSLIIITSFFIFSCSGGKLNNQCQKCRTGTFIYYYRLGNDTIMIERSDSLQIEKNLKSGFITKSKISWLSACNFELVYLTSSDSKMDSIADYIKKTPLETRIIKVERDYYVFESKMEGITQKLVDTTWFQSR